MKLTKQDHQNIGELLDMACQALVEAYSEEDSEMTTEEFKEKEAVMVKNDTEAGAKASCKSLRSLLEQLELAVKFGNAQDLESAANELLSHSRYDQFTGHIRKATYGPREQIVESANPVVAFEKLSQYKGKELAGASIHITCGHCGSSHKMVSSSGEWGAQHIDYVLDNFPKEL